MTPSADPAHMNADPIGADLPIGWLRAVTAEQHAITPATIAARTARRPAIRPEGREVPVAVSGWRDRANCLGIDPGLFFPDPWDHVGRDAALAVCAGCVVRDQCLMEALERGEKSGEFGIWGGTTERERRRLRRRLPRWARCRGCGGRYVKTSSGQRYCGDGCRGLSAKWRREVASNPGRRRSRRQVAS